MTTRAPKFKKPPSIRQEDQDSTIVIEAVIEAEPKPDCKWTLNNRPVQLGDRITAQFNQVKGTNEYQCSLRIKNVEVNDGGSYRLTAKNSAGELRAAVNLRLEAEEETTTKGRPPTFTQKPVIKQESVGKKVVFECKLTADPQPVCTWFRNDQPIESKGRYSISCQGLPDDTYVVSCTVSDISKSDAGIYRVVAKNASGEALATMNLSFDDEKGRPLISDKISIRPFATEADGNVLIECTCTADPAPEFVWYYKNNVISPSSKYSISSLSEGGNKYVSLLSVNNASKGDAGQYRLVAKNSHGEHSANINLDFTAQQSLPVSGFAPKVVSKPTYQKLNQDLVMKILFSADPTPLIKWSSATKDLGLMKFEQSMQKVGDDKYEAQLTIKNATTSDAALYECVAVNEHGSSTVRIDLRLLGGELKLAEDSYAEPKIIGSPRVVYDKSRNILIIICNLETSVPLNTGWLKSKMRVKTGGKYEVSGESVQPGKAEIQLAIKDYKPPADDGVYKLEMDWKSGKTALNIDVNSKNAEMVEGKQAPEEEKEGEMKIKKEPEKSLKGPEEKVEQKPAEPEKPAATVKGVLKQDVPPAKVEPAPAAAAGAKPKFVGNFRPINAFDGDKIMLQCNYAGDEPLTVSWTLDGKPLPDTEEYDHRRDANTISLGINDSYPQDSGTYRCRIQNPFGSDEKSCRVTIAPKRGKMARRKPKFAPRKVKPEVEEVKQVEKEKPKAVPGVKDEAKPKAKVPEKEPEKEKPVVPAEGKPEVEIPTVKGKPGEETRLAKPVDTTKVKDAPKEAAATVKPEGEAAPVAVRPEDAAKVKPLGEVIAKPKPGEKGVAEPKDEEVPGVKPEVTKVEAGEVAAAETPVKYGEKKAAPAKLKEVVAADSEKENVEAKPTVADKDEKPTKREVEKPAGKPGLKKIAALKPEKRSDRFSSATVTPIGVEGGNWPTLRKTTIAKKVPDHWVTHLVDTKASEEDGTATLEATFCRAGGKLRWYKNRVEIFHGHKYNFISEGPVQKLQINKLIPDDSGRYICSVNDIETKAWLEVTPARPEYDFYMRLPAKMEVFRTKPCFLECHVNRSDCPVKWLKGDMPIDENNKNYKSYLDGTRAVLRIYKASRKDEDKYSCIIDDGTGRSTECYLYVLEPQWRFSKKLPERLAVNEKDDIVLEVEVEDTDAECEWFVMGELLTDEDLQSGKYETVDDGHVRRLIVKNANPEKDAQIYECRTGVMSTSCSVHVNPLLRFVEGLKDMTVVENTDATLQVKLNKPKPSVIWLRDGKRILPSSNNVIMANGDVHTLTMKGLALEDGGHFTVKVDGLESSADLTVKEADKPPTFGSIPKSVTASVGKTIKIEVPFKGNPTPTVTWYKDGVPITEQTAKIDTDNSKSVLEIPVCKNDDKGVYKIELKNSSGKTEAEIDVSVCDRPGQPGGPMRTANVTATGCTVSWKPPENDGGTPITAYVVEKMDVSRGEWSVAQTVSPDKLSANVDKLIPGKQYKFRVLAKNKIGTSEPLEIGNPILAKDPYNPSSPPGDVKVIDVDSNFVKLGWSAPKEDGGSPVEKYVIERKEGAKDWTKVGETSPDQLEFTALNLIENKPYEFRVVAINKAGPSQPGILDKPIRPEAKLVRPLIRKGQMTDVTVKKGQVVKLSAPYSAKPQATYTWQKDGKTLVPDNRMTINFTDKLCELIIKDAERTDVGSYVVELSNEAGSDSAKAMVVVLGPPGKPNKPLKVSDITSKSAVLNWNPPDDDGGKPIQNYVIEKRERGGDWTRVGTTSDTSYKVPKLKEGHQYDFRVMAENALGVGEPVATDEPITAKNPYDAPGPTGKPVVAHRDRKQIQVEWQPPSDDGGAPVFGYIVERRQPDSDKWKPAHTEDVITDTTFTDKKVVANAPYEYRVRAVNDAGPGMPSPSTGTVYAKPEKEKPAIDLGKIPGIQGRKEIRINAGEPLEIDLDFIGAPEPVVSWTRNNTELKDSAPLKIETGEDHTKLSIPVAKRGDSGDYHVVVKNDLGQDQADIRVVVMDVPSQCVGPLTPIETGKDCVTLEWKQPEDDGGSPITGYLVEKCPEGSDEWEIAGEASYQPRITLTNLKPMEKYRFRVRAENKSGQSEPLETTSPVLIKPPYDPPSSPSTPEVTDFDTDHISIAWEKPSSDGGNPISGYIVEMKDARGDWVQCTQGPISDTKFTATAVKPNHAYEFRVKAVNDAGPGELSRASKPQKAESPISPPGPTDVPAIEKADKHSVTLSWNTPEDDGGSKITRYIVEMRPAGAGDWVEVGETPGKEKQLTVPNLKENSEVSFRVKAVNKAGVGTPSPQTSLVTVQNPPAPPSFLDLSKLKDVVVRAGHGFAVAAPYEANPPATVECMNGDTLVITDDRMTVKCDGGQVSIATSSSKREDSGTYRVTLRNNQGSTAATFQVTVLDVPLKPEGPLDVSGVDHDRCTLMWNSPKDDGGLPVTSYIIEKRPVGTEKWTKACPSTSANFQTVTGLENGKRYEFRVIAENQEGRSEPLVVDEPVLIKSPHKPPDAPGTPRCTDHTANSITIAWNKPLSDGGTPVTGYIVESRESEAAPWKPLFKNPRTTTSATIPKLVDGQFYEFRVAAVNLAGQSPWAETEEPIQARPPDAAPTIPPSLTKSIKVVVGEAIDIAIPFSASPLPESTFYKNNLIVPEDERHIFSTNVEQASLHIPEAEMTDAGNYSCTLRNVAGEATSQVLVTVIDKPQKPQGPLVASDVSPTGCKLSWSAPLNDGNSPITNYVVEKCDVSSGEWQVVSKFCRNPEYDVFDLSEGIDYKFRVSAENEAGLSEPLEIEKPVKAKYPAAVPSPPTDFKVDENTFDNVALSWNPPRKDGGSRVTGYMVERRPDDIDDWEPVNIEPVRNTWISFDSLLPNKTYNFRVCAVNHVGPSEFAELERPLVTKPVPKPPSPPHAPEAISVGSNFVELVWEPPAEAQESPLTYRIEKKLPGSPVWEPAIKQLLTDNYAAVSGLPQNAEVEFRVCASNPHGDSDWSESSGKIKITGFPNGKEPSFTTPLKDASASPSTSVSLDVDYTAEPAPYVKWLKNGLEITPGAKYAINSSDNHSTLVIHDIWEFDDGSQFTCEATNPLGTAVTTCKLNVSQPPTIGKFNRELTAAKGDNVRCEIPVGGTRDLDMQLRKMDASETAAPERFRISDDGAVVTLSLKDAQLADSGDYMLVLKNKAGTASMPVSLKVTSVPSKPEGPLEAFDVDKTSCKLSWKPPVEDGGSKVTHYVVEKHDVAKPSDHWVQVDECHETAATVDNLLQDHEYEFRVKAVNADGESEPLFTSQTVVAALPFGPPRTTGAPTVTEVGSNFVRLSWPKAVSDSRSAATTYRIEKRPKGAESWQTVNAGGTPLTWTSGEVPNLIEGQEYQFRIIAENEAGSSEPSAPTDYLLVEDQYGVKVPEIVKKIEDQTVDEGHSVKFEAELSRPDCDVTWYKGTAELHSGTDFTINKSGTSCSLLVNNAHFDDNEETITMKAKNPAGTRTCRARLFVRSKPKIKVPPRYQSTQELSASDHDIVIKLPYTSNPAPEAAWYINGQPLPEDETIDSTLTDHMATLRIRNPAILGDSGQIQLKLTNPLGTGAASINYIVSQKPAPPSNVTADNVYDDCVTLSWQPPVSDGGSPISDYSIEIFDTSSPLGGEWKTVGACKSTRFVVPNLQPSNVYHFRVTAENANGCSEPSIPLENVVTSASNDRGKTKAPYGYDKDGKRIRGIEGQAPDDYDRIYHDIWKTGTPHSPVTHAGSVYDKYDVYEEIGRSPFAVVHRAVDKATGRSYAVKFVETPADSDQSLIQKEVDMMSDVSNPNIISLKDVFYEPEETALVYEMLTGDTMLDQLSHDGRLTELEAVKIMRQVCDAVRTLHDNHIAHLDLKPEAFVNNTSKSPQSIKLADFSLAKKLLPEDRVQVSLASVEFAAPEILNQEPVGFYTDMWAVGALAYAILAGEAPFQGSTPEEVAAKIAKGEVHFSEKAFDRVSDQAKDFIGQLLKKDKNSRMGIHDALNHPWLKEEHMLEAAPSLSPNYDRLIDRTKQKYRDYTGEEYPAPKIGLGRSAWFSSRIRREPRRYKLYDSNFDRREYVPKMYIFKHDSFAMEGDDVELQALVISLGTLTVNWSHGGDVKQSPRMYKRSRNNEYILEIRKCVLSDAGEYVVTASNQYGDQSKTIHLYVEPLKEKPQVLPRKESKERRHVEYALIDIWQEPNKAPFFTYLLRTRVVQYGSPVKLTCTVTGRPAPKITWFKGTKEIGEDDNYIINYGHGAITLGIAAVSQDDAGTYRCHAENALGSADTSCQLLVVGGPRRQFIETSYERTERRSHRTETTVDTATSYDQARLERQALQSAPSISEELSSMTLFQGATLLLRCGLSGRPKPSVSWYKDGDLLSPTDRAKQSYEGGYATLNVDPVNTHDSGEYKIVAKNEAGEVSSSALVVVRKLEGRKPSTITEETEVPEATAMAGEPAVDAENKAELTPTVTEEPTLKDKAETAIVDRIKFAKHLESCLLRSGDTLALACELSGPVEDDTIVVWRRNDREVPNNPEFQKLKEGNKFSLNVAEVFPEDTGVFTVECKDDVGMSRSTCNVIVYEEDDPAVDNPLITKFITSQNANAGDLVQFVAETSRPCDAQWLFEDKVPSDLLASCEAQTEDGLRHEFTIPDVSPANSGTYTLTLTDRSDQTSVDLKAYLNVY